MFKKNSILNCKFIANDYAVDHKNGYSVVPVTMLVEGVHEGSMGAVLYNAEDIKASESKWNGIPITLGHPGNKIDDSVSILGNVSNLGNVSKASFQENGLKAELKFKDSELLNNYRLKNSLDNGEKIEVSTGLYSDLEYSQGIWNEQRYIAIAHNYKPDHLAVLLDNQGACSVKDGCGIRNEKYQKLRKEQCKTGVFTSNVDVGYREISSKIQQKLDAMDTNARIHYLIDVFEGSFIYEVSIRETGIDNLYRREYELQEDGTVEFTGESILITRVVTYTPVTMNINKGGYEVPGTKCCKEEVEAIINSKNTRFEESDRDFLENQTKESIIKLLPIEPEPLASPVFNAEQALEVLKDQIKTPEQFMELLPSEIKAQFEYGLNLHENERKKLMEHIVNNAPDVYTAEELKNKSTKELSKIRQLIKVPVNYSLQNSGSNMLENTEVLLPAGVKEENK